MENRVKEEAEYTVWLLQRNVKDLGKCRKSLGAEEYRDIALLIKELQKIAGDEHVTA